MGGTTPYGLIHVLAVDDETAILHLVREALAPMGCDVREARSGAEALAKAREASPDLILLDMQLPDMTGLEVLHRLRASRWGAALRVVAMDGGNGAHDRDRWTEAGCLSAIEKPFTTEILEREVDHALTGVRPPRALPPEASKRRPERIGEILVANALITAEQLTQAIAAQAGSGKRLGQLLVEQGAVTEDDIAWALSYQLLYPYIFITSDIIDDEVVRLLPEAFLRAHRVLPIHRFDEEMTLAMADPTDESTVEEVAAQTGLRVNRALALDSNIEGMLDRLFSRADEASARGGPAGEAQYFHFHLVQALQQGASEIHFDPTLGSQPRVRYRLQGVLVDRGGNPADLHSGILHHLRALIGLGETAAGTAPVTVKAGATETRLVVTIVPTTAGAAGIVTLYPYRTGTPDLTPLGVGAEMLGALRGAVESSRGAVIVGCSDPGLRSAVLHGILPADLSGKIWAVETLPLYRWPAVSQTVVGSSDEVAVVLNGASGAGADLIIVDDASSHAALAAALTSGRTRMVLAGHPQDDVLGLFNEAVAAAGTPLVASTLRAILAARPVRLLCPECREPVPQRSGTGDRHTFTARGCRACNFTGFRGSRLLTEVWLVAPSNRALLRTGSRQTTLDHIGRTVGSSMRSQGIGLVEDGLISAAELSRVVEGA